MLAAPELTRRLLRRPQSIIERLRQQDRARLSRIADRLGQLKELKAERANARQQHAYLSEFAARGKLYREKVTYDEGEDKTDWIKTVKQIPDPALQEVAAELQVINGKIAALEAEVEAPCMTAGRLETLLKAVPATATITENIVTPELGDESAPAALVRTRREIIEITQERANVARKHRTKAEVLEAARDQIRALAGRGQPKVRPLLEGGTIEFPMTKLPRTTNFFHFIPDGAALVCWLMESEILRKVEDLIDFNTDAANAMPQAAQAAALAKLDGQLVRLRREEAALVETIVADGGNAWHFPDAPLEAVLGISIN